MLISVFDRLSVSKEVDNKAFGGFCAIRIDEVAIGDDTVACVKDPVAWNSHRQLYRFSSNQTFFIILETD